MTSHYRRGADFERRVIAKLEALGFTAWTRSAGSHGPADIWAVKNKQLHLIQVKGGKAKLSGRERLELVDLAHDCGAVPVLVTRGLKMEVLSGPSEAAA